MRISSVAVAVAAGALATLGLTAPASADPGNASDAFLLECDNGNTYSVTVAGHGLFTPAHDLESNAILVPTAFGEFSGTVTDSSGTVIDEFTDPAVTKGASTKQRATTTTCTYTIMETFEDPDLGTLTFTGTGTVTGFVTPVR